MLLTRYHITITIIGMIIYICNTYNILYITVTIVVIIIKTGVWFVFRHTPRGCMWRTRLTC